MSDTFGARSATAPYGTSTDEGRSDYGRGSSFESGIRSRSTSGMEQDAEATRSGIGDTINELKDRFSPETVIQYGTDYVRGPGGQRLLGAARENPMAAALALAGIGWLLYTANRTSSPRPSGAIRGQGATGSGYTGPTSSGGTQAGVMGDGTMEQNLNQSGDASARISRDEVEDAFGSGTRLDDSLR